MAEFSRRFANLLKARFPYLYISTWEEERALTVMRAVANDEALIKTHRRVFVWSLTTGMTSGNDGGNDETKSPVQALEVIKQCDEPALFVMKDLHIFFGG